MKKKIQTVLIIFSALSILLYACRKSVTEDETDQDIEYPPSAPFPKNPVMNCPYSPDYGDTLICSPNGNGQDLIVSPVNNPGAGKFLSWPMGLMVDSITGAINISQSEPGLRYMIGFIKQGTTDTCLNPLTISGMSYLDSVFVLSAGEKTSIPYFNANSYLNSVCASGNCEFDIKGKAAKDNVVVNAATGVIDLQKTLDQGAFGTFPENGDIVETTIRYRINDGCSDKEQKIKVKLMYFTNKSQIDVALINEVLSKQASIRSGNTNTSYKPRPPLIIITRYN